MAGTSQPRRDQRELARLLDPLRIEPGTRVRLPDDRDPAATAAFVNKAEARDLLGRSVRLLAEYQARLAAQASHGLLVCLQALDAGGKDGTIRHVMSGVNPQGVTVSSFKVPSETELRHDYLWRYQARLPERGEIGIFNRSHYEEVLVVRVHPELLERQRLAAGARRGGLWRRRYTEINQWERYLVDNGIRIVKLFLNISKEEQRRRFLKRLEVPEKHWKFSAADVAERAHWDEYQKAFSQMLSHTSTPWAPWYVVPADHKWFARVCASAAIVQAIMQIDPRYPVPSPKDAAALLEARHQLEAEAPTGRLSAAPAAP